MGSAARLQQLSLVALGGGLALGEGIAVVAAVLLTLSTLVRWRAVSFEPLRGARVRALRNAVGVWLACGVVAALSSGEPWRLTELARGWPLGLAIVLPLSLSALPRIWIERAVIAFVATAALSSAFGLVQVAFDMWPGEFVVRTDTLSTQQRFGAGGFFFHRLKLAHVNLAAALVLVSRVIDRDTDSRAGGLSHRRHSLEWVALVVIVTATVASGARAATAGLLVGVALLVARRWLSARACLGVGAAALIVGLVVVFCSGALSEAMPARAFIWQQAERALADHPLGVGLGNYRDVGERYLDTAEPGRVPPRIFAHSLLMHTLVETGPIGAFALVMACFGLMWSWLRRDDGAGRLGAALLGAWWTVGTVHVLFFHLPVSLVVAASMGTLVWMTAEVKNPIPATASR